MNLDLREVLSKVNDVVTRVNHRLLNYSSVSFEWTFNYLNQLTNLDPHLFGWSETVFVPGFFLPDQLDLFIWNYEEITLVPHYLVPNPNRIQHTFLKIVGINYFQEIVPREDWMLDHFSIPTCPSWSPNNSPIFPDWAVTTVIFRKSLIYEMGKPPFAL